MSTTLVRILALSHLPRAELALVHFLSLFQYRHVNVSVKFWILVNFQFRFSNQIFSSWSQNKKYSRFECAPVKWRRQRDGWSSKIQLKVVFSRSRSNVRVNCARKTLRNQKLTVQNFKLKSRSKFRPFLIFQQTKTGWVPRMCTRKWIERKQRTQND